MFCHTLVTPTQNNFSKKSCFFYIFVGQAGQEYSNPNHPTIFLYTPIKLPQYEKPRKKRNLRLK